MSRELSKSLAAVIEAGAGECPMVGLAPAIGNAIFDATGVQIRSLPMVPDGLKAG